MLNWIDIEKLALQGNPEPPRRVEKNWKEVLTPEQYHISREHGTERAFSSEMCSRFEPGIYACVCCDTELFDSTAKFESGTGWPSFTAPLEDNLIAYYGDNSLGYTRVEVRCNICDGHLGHVFPDGPEPSGLRYCINAVVIKKV